jgi:hypothetical protein
MIGLAALALLAVLSPARAPAPAGRPGASGDACALLTATEIRGVQGGVVKNRKPTSLSQGGLAVSQCFFEIDPFSSSVSLEVVRRGAPGGSGRSPRERWRETFHRAPAAKKSEEGEARESRLEPVSGVGEEAFWVPSRMGGALYVLGSDVSLRLSVGGKGDAETKRERSKFLARKALEKL